MWAKFEIQILTVLVAVFAHFCPYKRENWHSRADLQSPAPCQISRLSEQRVALVGRKNHFYAKIFNTSTTLVLFEIVCIFNYSLTEHLVKIEPY